MSLSQSNQKLSVWPTMIEWVKLQNRPRPVTPLFVSLPVIRKIHFSKRSAPCARMSESTIQWLNTGWFPGGFLDSNLYFRWQISAPTGASGATHPMSDVSSNTFFTSVNTITLDSIYFTSGSRVQCHARAVKVFSHLWRHYDAIFRTTASLVGSLAHPLLPFQMMVSVHLDKRAF